MSIDQAVYTATKYGVLGLTQSSKVSYQSKFFNLLTPSHLQILFCLTPEDFTRQWGGGGGGGG